MLLHTTPFRFAWTFLLAFFLASNVNWGIAEFLLNPWAIPLLDGFMREGEAAGGGLNIARMTLGFLLPQLVACLLAASLPWPAGWAARAVYGALLVATGGFFGTYTFLSGWGNVNWYPLMGAAVADTACLVIGTLTAGFLQRGSAPRP